MTSILSSSSSSPSPSPPKLKEGGDGVIGTNGYPLSTPPTRPLPIPKSASSSPVISPNIQIHNNHFSSPSSSSSSSSSPSHDSDNDKDGWGVDELDSVRPRQRSNSVILELNSVSSMGISSPSPTSPKSSNKSYPHNIASGAPSSPPQPSSPLSPSSRSHANGHGSGSSNLPNSTANIHNVTSSSSFSSRASQMGFTRLQSIDSIHSYRSNVNQNNNKTSLSQNSTGLSILTSATPHVIDHSAISSSASSSSSLPHREGSFSPRSEEIRRMSFAAATFASKLDDSVVIPLSSSSSSSPSPSLSQNDSNSSRQSGTKKTQNVISSLSYIQKQHNSVTSASQVNAFAADHSFSSPSMPFIISSTSSISSPPTSPIISISSPLAPPPLDSSSPPPPLNVSVNEYRTRQGAHNKVLIDYKIDVSSPPLEWSVHKSYEEFQIFHSQLKEQFPSSHSQRLKFPLLPKLPSSKIIGGQKPEFLDSRRRDLHEYLTLLINIPIYSTSVPMLQFLGVLSDSSSLPKDFDHVDQVLHVDAICELLCEGDIILMKTEGVLQAMQRSLTKSHYDHVGIVVKSPWDSPHRYHLCLLEATLDGVRKYPLFRRLQAWSHSNASVVVRQLKMERGMEILKKLGNFVEEVEGLPYSLTPMKFIKKNYANGNSGNSGNTNNSGHGSINEVNSNSNNSKAATSYFCSELVASAYFRMDLLGSDHQSTTFLPVTFAQSNVSLKLLNGSYLDKEIFIKFSRPEISTAVVKKDPKTMGNGNASGAMTGMNNITMMSGTGMGNFQHKDKDKEKEREREGKDSPQFAMYSAMDYAHSPAMQPSSPKSPTSASLSMSSSNSSLLPLTLSSSSVGDGNNNSYSVPLPSPSTVTAGKSNSITLQAPIALAGLAASLLEMGERTRKTIYGMNQGNYNESNVNGNGAGKVEKSSFSEGKEMVKISTEKKSPSLSSSSMSSSSSSSSSSPSLVPSATFASLDISSNGGRGRANAQDRTI